MAGNSALSSLDPTAEPVCGVGGSVLLQSVAEADIGREDVLI